MTPQTVWRHSTEPAGRVPASVQTDRNTKEITVRKCIPTTIVSTAATLLLTCGFACNTTPNPLGGGNLDGLTVVRTSVKMDVAGSIIGGDDIIVFGTGFLKGVAFIVPSANDKAARPIPNSDRFDSRHFAVSGKKIALLDPLPPGAGVLDGGQITIFDTTSGASSPIPLSEINEKVGPTQNTDGQLQASGNFIACLNDADLVSDGNALKVIDVSGGSPAIIAFTKYPGTNTTRGLVEFAIDPTLSRVVAVSENGVLLVYDIKNPTAAPTEFDTKSSANGSNGIDDRFPIITDNGKVLFRDHTGQFGRATLLDTATGVFKTLSSKDLANDSTLTLRGNLFCFFDDDNAAGGRAVYGRLTDPAPTFADVNDRLSPDTLANGILGFGRRCGVTKDGKYFFISGSQIDNLDGHVQVSSGGKFSLLSDPAGEVSFGVLGASIDCSGSVPAFKAGQEGANEVFVAFIR